MSGSARWACLMYHATPSAAEYTDYFAVTATNFAEQVTAIDELGLLGKTLEACCVTPHDVRQVAITFDDAHQSNYTEAWPVLERAGMTATVFVVPAWVGTDGYCTWSELRELHAAGWSIQSHTFSHPFLSTLAHDALVHELRDSRDVIEQQIGGPVRTLALPNGDWPARSHREVLREAGYDLVASSRWHANGAAEATRGVIGRYTVRRATRRTDFVARLTALPGFWSREGLRLSALSAVRAALGVERYRTLRRQLLGEQSTSVANASSSQSSSLSLP
jgi:peptidoglycan/xylan/chitin deacetylase (PgdA/CDA1 family)